MKKKFKIISASILIQVLFLMLIFTFFALAYENEVFDILSYIFFALLILLCIAYAILIKKFESDEVDNLKELSENRDDKISEDMGVDSIIRLNFNHNGIQDAIYLNRKDEKFAIGTGTEYQILDMNDVSMLKITKYKIEFWLKKELKPITLTDNNFDENIPRFIGENTKNALENIFSPYIYANKTNKTNNKNITVEIKKEKIKKKTCPYCGFNMNEDIDTCPQCGANQK